MQDDTSVITLVYLGAGKAKAHLVKAALEEGGVGATIGEMILADADFFQQKGEAGFQIMIMGKHYELAMTLLRINNLEPTSIRPWFKPQRK
jgi:hypothetical protein